VGLLVHHGLKAKKTKHGSLTKPVPEVALLSSQLLLTSCKSLHILTWYNEAI